MNRFWNDESEVVKKGYEFVAMVSIAASTSTNTNTENKHVEILNQIWTIIDKRILLT